MADFGVAVVGAGVVGLAVAARLSARGDEVLVLERRERHGSETSSRNSEVIHGGMYYPTGSLKARLCVEGNRRLYEYCAQRNVPHRRLGKLIVGKGPEDDPALDALLARGRANGVEMERLDAEGVHRLEPHVRAAGGLLSPNTGIVSAHGLMDALLAEARGQGALLQARTTLVALSRDGGDWRLTLRGSEGEETVSAERVVNAAGLESDTVAALAGIDVAAAGYTLHWCKGSYFSVPPRLSRLVSRLVYPVPGPVSLGTHAVVGLDGRVRFGPDAEYLEERRLDYAIDEGKRRAFAPAVQRLVPEIGEDDLAPDMSGIRAKLQGPGQGFRDFVVAEEGARGCPGLVSLVGIDSPGLTSSLAIAAEVERLLA